MVSLKTLPINSYMCCIAFSDGVYKGSRGGGDTLILDTDTQGCFAIECYFKLEE